MDILLGLVFVACLVGVAYPYRPFRKRWHALLAATAVLLLFPKSPHQPSRLTSFASLRPSDPGGPKPCADQRACDEANRIAYSRPLREIDMSSKKLERPERQVTLDRLTWRKGGFGVVLIASFRLTNHLPVVVKDIEIACDVYGASGTKIGAASKVLFQRIRPGTARSVSDFDVGLINNQASAADCRVASVVTE